MTEKLVWERIREARHDLTDYVVHLTRARFLPYVAPLDVLLEILRSGYIRPTFGRKQIKGSVAVVTTVKGPEPAVCLTEQPLSAILKILDLIRDRYRGYGIAYHKVPLHMIGGLPVLYGTPDLLGRSVKVGEPSYQKDK